MADGVAVKLLIERPVAGKATPVLTVIKVNVDGMVGIVVPTMAAPMKYNPVDGTVYVLEEPAAMVAMFHVNNVFAAMDVEP